MELLVNPLLENTALFIFLYEGTYEGTIRIYMNEGTIIRSLHTKVLKFPRRFRRVNICSEVLVA